MTNVYQNLSTNVQRKFNYTNNKSRIPTLALGLTISCILMITSVHIYNGKLGSLNYIKFDITNNVPIDLIPVPRKKSNLIRNKPVVLYWERYFHTQYNHFVPNEKTKIDCPYECIHTYNRSYGAEAKVRIFHHRSFNSADIPPNNPEALNVYYILEPPHLSYSRYNVSLISPDYFNLTGSYRSSSEIYFPYDYFIQRDGNETTDQVWTEEQIDQKMAKKRKSALVAMSNCQAESKRHDYVHALEEHINVTKIGKCEGQIACGKDDGTKVQHIDIECMQELIDKHYFYLAFENSVCPEYVTEKFWRVKNLIVPIVLSRAVIPEHIPSNTYIAASEFESPKALTDYLQFLINNKTEYRKYFEWTKLYRKTRLSEEEIMVSCQLCKLAHQNKPYRIENYKEYWSNKECARDYALNLLTNQPNNINNVFGHEQKLAELMKSTYRPRSIGKIL